jgi:ribonuclease J
MTVVEYGGRLLVIDCGVLFPENDDHPGVDLILPDFDYIQGRLLDIDAIVLTHGHEDHIGAIPYLLGLKDDLLLVGSKFTLALVKAKLVEHGFDPPTLEVREHEVHSFGNFECEFVAVNHSIPDALAVAVRTDAGLLVHTGDFKMDQFPIDGRLTDLRHLARLAEEGIDLLLSDSTNAESFGFVPWERDVGPVLADIIGHASRRVIVASFASHVHRVSQVLQAAQMHGRKVAFVGRSMVRNMTIARDLGYLHIPDDLLIESRSLGSYPPERTVLMCTGSQGEPLAALARMANRAHAIHVEPEDTVILASSLVPGNETAVFRVVNGLVRCGARVLHKENAPVHVSGHANSGELTYLFNLLAPRNVMPVEGELRHLAAAASLARACGVPNDRVVTAVNGDVVDLVDGHAEVVGAVPCGYAYVDGSTVGELSEASLKDRRRLGEEGFVTVVVVLDTASGKLVGVPDVHFRGLADNDALFQPVHSLIEEAVSSAVRDGTLDTRYLQDLVRRTVTKWLSVQHGRRPLVLPIIVEV